MYYVLDALMTVSTGNPEVARQWMAKMRLKSSYELRTLNIPLYFFTTDINLRLFLWFMLKPVFGYKGGLGLMHGFRWLRNPDPVCLVLDELH